MKSIFTGAGYYRNDERACDRPTIPGVSLDEDDILICAHNQEGIRKSEWKLRGGFCTHCGQPVCYHCFTRIPEHGCENFIRRLEAAIARQHRREQNARVMGI